MMDTINYFGNQFLIAMPAMDDPNFVHTVTYLCEHNQYGAMGIIINRPMVLSINDVLKHMQIEGGTEKLKNAPVLFGGPLHQERGFVIHKKGGAWRSSLDIKELSITTSRDILEAIAKGEGPENLLISLGCTGWAPGQLEEEIKKNMWLTVDVDLDILFHIPFEERWGCAAKLLGIDFQNLSDDIGHA